MNDNDQSLTEMLSSIREVQQEIESSYDDDAENFWNNLTEEQRLYAFYSVSKRIHQGEIQEQGSYRYVLYDVFGFGMESYGIGMMCGYMDIHNSIFVGQQQEKSDEDLPDGRSQQ